MPDDDHLGGTRSGDPHSGEPHSGGSPGHGRRHRRAAEEPEEQPRRRRRSMEDNGGGLSVADLVQRHTGSRTNLPLPPAQPAPGGRRALPDPPADQPGPRRRPADGSNGHGPRPGEAPAAAPQWPDQPGAGGARRAPGQGSGPRPGAVSRPPSGGLPGRPQAGPMPGGREAAAPPPASRHNGRQPSGPLPPADVAAEHPPVGHPPGPPRRHQSGPLPAGPVPSPGRRPGPAAGPDEFPAGPPKRPGPVAGPAADDFPAAPPKRPGPTADDFPAGHPRRSGPADDFPAGHPQRPSPSCDDLPVRRPHRPGPDDFAAGHPQRPGPPHDDRPNGRPPRSTADDFPAGHPQRPSPSRDDLPVRRPHRPGPDEFPAGHPQRPGPSLDDRPGRAPYRQPGPEADLPPGARESGIRRALGGPPTPPPPGRPSDGEPPPGAGQRSMPVRPNEAPAAPGQGTRGGPVPLPPPRRPEEDPISMTTEMEAIGEEVQKRRTIDHTLARFSAVHDELKAEEREKKSKRRKLMPWQHDDELDELDRLEELVGRPVPAIPAEPEPEPELEPEPEPAQDEDDEPVGTTRLREKRNRRRDRSALAIRVFAASAAVLVFVGTGIAWGFKSWVDARAQQVDALDPNSASIQDADAQRGDENFLLVGSDTRAGAAAEDGVGSESDIVGARSDTVMIAHIPKSRERVVVVSFPRDLEVNRPDCEGWDPKSGEYTGSTEPGADLVKINTAYQVGGPKCVTKMVQKLSGLAINHFVGIDFHGFKDMVDAVDGVQVCVEEPMKDDVLGTIVPEAGKNVTLTGDQALNFVRARHVAGDVTSDYGRIKRQQRFLSSLLRKAMSSEVLLDPGKLTGFVDAFSKSTFGDNIGVDQMFVLGQSMQGIEAGQVTFVTVPTVGESNERGNEELLVEDTEALFRAIREDTPLPGEAPRDGGEGGEQPNAQMASNLLVKQQATEPVDPKTIKIQVLNGGNDTDGIAGDTGDALSELGFQVLWVDTSPEQVDRTVIKYSKTKQAQAQTLAAAVPGAELVEDPSLGGAVQLIIGPGFDGEVVSPTGGGGPPPELPDNLSTINAGDVSCA